MDFRLLLTRLKKLAFALFNPMDYRYYFQGIIPSYEHLEALRYLKSQGIISFVDAGANKGQFALMILQMFGNNSYILSFEPLSRPFKQLSSLRKRSNNFHPFNVALGANIDNSIRMKYASRDDSSSLLEMTSLQKKTFNLHDSSLFENVQLSRLDSFNSFIRPNSCLKIDVQGYELEVLKGAVSCIDQISYIYVETSEFELYKNQPLAPDVVSYLHSLGFKPLRSYNPSFDRYGRRIQSDWLFCKSTLV